jgi:hypothetical protein
MLDFWESLTLGMILGVRREGRDELLRMDARVGFDGNKYLSLRFP